MFVSFLHAFKNPLVDIPFSSKFSRPISLLYYLCHFAGRNNKSISLQNVVLFGISDNISRDSLKIYFLVRARNIFFNETINRYMLVRGYIRYDVRFYKWSISISKVRTYMEDIELLENTYIYDRKTRETKLNIICTYSYIHRLYRNKSANDLFTGY